jgi:hypothetical protein
VSRGLAVRPGDTEHPHLVRRRRRSGRRSDRSPRTRATRTCVTGAASGRSTRGRRRRHAPAAAWSWPSWARCRMQQNKRARWRATVMGDVRHVDVASPSELEHGGVVEEGVQVHGILSVTEQVSQRYWPAGPQPGPGVARRPPRRAGSRGCAGGWRPRARGSPLPRSTSRSAARSRGGRVGHDRLERRSGDLAARWTRSTG